MSVFHHDDPSDKDRLKALEAHVLALEARIVALDDRLDLDMRRIDARLTAHEQVPNLPLFRRIFGPPVK